MTFSPEVERALEVSLVAHQGQFRKGGDVPYAVHPAHMALILARVDADEEVIQAALLHDVVEDCDDWDAERLRAEFGDAVADIVADLTEDKSQSWVERKQAALEHVAVMSTPSLLVKAADKLHNLESLACQFAAASSTEEVWKHFTGGRERTLEMDRRLVEALAARLPADLAEALQDALERVRQLA
ncbi:MAG: (p)ppGpp synthase/HD superfamily hydrolase [Candidatus Paceibacteria bacterium]